VNLFHETLITGPRDIFKVVGADVEVTDDIFRKRDSEADAE